MCVCVIRGSRVHDACSSGAGAGPSIIMVHPKVVTKFMSNDGCKRRKVVVRELEGQEGGTEGQEGGTEGVMKKQNQNADVLTGASTNVKQEVAYRINPAPVAPGADSGDKGHPSCSSKTLLPVTREPRQPQPPPVLAPSPCLSALTG